MSHAGHGIKTALGATNTYVSVGLDTGGDALRSFGAS
jgi:hypothetical protein